MLYTKTKNKWLRGFYIFILIGILGCADQEARDKKTPPTFSSGFCATEQSTVGGELNRVENGAWFGRHTNKIVRSGKHLFTYTMPNTTDSRQIVLYSKEDGKDWVKGKKLYVSRPPDLLMDSKGFIHVIGYQSFDVQYDGLGRLFHMQFKRPLSVDGEFKFEFIVPDWRTMVIDSALLANTGSTEIDLQKRIQEGWLPKVNDSIYSTYYSGATIDDRNNIHVVYTSSQPSDAFHSISKRTYDALTEQWSYSLLLDSLPERLCYPYVIWHDDQLHAVMVEDQYDSLLEVTGYPYRYGKIVYLHRSSANNTWVTETLINLNDTFSDVIYIQKRGLRVSDFIITGDDTIHVLVRYMDNPITATILYFKKSLNDTEWRCKKLPMKYCQLPRFWQSEKQELFVLVMLPWLNFTHLISLRDYSSKRVAAFALKINDPNPFITNKRSKVGEGKRDSFDMVIFDGSSAQKALVFSVTLR